jgi:hypothetical protein
MRLNFLRRLEMNSFKLPVETSEDESAENIPAPIGQRGTILEPAPTEKPAWEQITDQGWDREALQLWWTGYTCPEIGPQLQPPKAPKTIRNQLYLLRKIYGIALVPKNPQRWEHIRKRGAT